MHTLPPEIRNQIYTYLFPPQRVEILRVKTTDSQGRTRYRLTHIQLPPRDPATQHQTCLPHKAKANKTNANAKAKASKKRSGSESVKPQLSLPFTSPLLSTETTPLLYTTTQFLFRSTNTMKRFLSTVPRHHQALITHVEIHNEMYNEPRLLAFRTHKLRSDMAFFLACEEMARAFVRLQVLHFSFRVFRVQVPVPVSVGMGPVVGEGWSVPVLVFKRARDGKGVRFARVRLDFGEAVAKEVVVGVEREVEREVMDAVAVQVREDERLARELAGPVKAVKVLRVVFQ